MGAETAAPIRLLTVSGSLQQGSTNRAALHAAAVLARSVAVTVEDFSSLAEVPAFDPDRADEAIRAVEEWRQAVAAADAILVAAPEYAGALAGAIKNAFDWLVGSGELYRKPMAVISAGTSGGEHARRMLAQTLTWQGAYVVAELGIAAARTKFDSGGRITDDATAAAIASVTHTLVGAATLPSRDVVALATRVVGELGIDTAHVAPEARRS